MGDHLIVMHSAVRALPGYSRHEAPSMLMEGASIARDSEHGRAVTAQLTRRHGTLEEAIDAGNFALGAAAVPRGVRRPGTRGVRGLLLQPARLGAGNRARRARGARSGARADAGPALPRAEDIVEHVVDGDYEELRDASLDRLEVDDLRRRVEDDVPEALVLPPRRAYQVEALTRSDDPEFEGWTFFLDLWTDAGPARLHIEGSIQESAGQVAVALGDILP